MKNENLHAKTPQHFYILCSPMFTFKSQHHCWRNQELDLLLHSNLGKNPQVSKIKENFASIFKASKWGVFLKLGNGLAWEKPFCVTEISLTDDTVSKPWVRELPLILLFFLAPGHTHTKRKLNWEGTEKANARFPVSPSKGSRTVEKQRQAVCQGLLQSYPLLPSSSCWNPSMGKGTSQGWGNITGTREHPGSKETSLGQGIITGEHPRDKGTS